MMQSEATMNRATGSAQHDDEDALFDSWLASLSTREFEFVLDRIAALETSARPEATA